jgi:hypothetical protein
MAPGRQMGPVNPGLQDTMAAAASQFEANNPGYKVQVNSGARGSNDPHGRHNAVDMQIIGPDGQPIKNSGADRTGKYAELANNALAAQRALHPELNGKFMWGGYFNKDGGHGFADPSTGNNDPDLMHFDIEGNRSHRTAMRDRYYSTFRQGPQGQRAQQPANVGPQDQGSYAQADQYDGRGRGGTRGDRNNNPGNVKTRNAPGQIGIDREGHAIFSNWGDGRRAQAGVLQRVYNGQSINQMSRRYTATVGDQPAWARTVASVSGLDPNQPLNMNDPRILDGIQRGIWQAEGTRIPGGGGRTPPATAVGPTPTRTPTPTPTRGDFPNTSPRAEVNPPNLAQLYGMDWV